MTTSDHMIVQTRKHEDRVRGMKVLVSINTYSACHCYICANITGTDVAEFRIQK